MHYPTCERNTNKYKTASCFWQNWLALLIKIRCNANQILYAKKTQDEFENLMEMSTNLTEENLEEYPVT